MNWGFMLGAIEWLLHHNKILYVELENEMLPGLIKNPSTYWKSILQSFTLIINANV